MGICRPKLEKSIVIFEISTLVFVGMQNKKNSKLARAMSYVGICKLKFETTIVTIEISPLEFVKMKIFVQNKKKSSLQPKLLYLGSFGLWFWKTIDIFEISTLEFVKKKFLANTVGFAIGSAFPGVQWSTFSEGAAPGPDPLFQVYPSSLINLSVYFEVFFVDITKL